MTTPPTIIKANPDDMTADELKAAIDRQPLVMAYGEGYATPPQPPEIVYDPTQEIIVRLDRIAAALEESAAMVREEFRAKGYAIPKKD